MPELSPLPPAQLPPLSNNFVSLSQFSGSCSTALSTSLQPRMLSQKRCRSCLQVINYFFLESLNCRHRRDRGCLRSSTASWIQASPRDSRHASFGAGCTMSKNAIISCRTSSLPSPQTRVHFDHLLHRLASFLRRLSSSCALNCQMRSSAIHLPSRTRKHNLEELDAEFPREYHGCTVLDHDVPATT